MTKAAAFLQDAGENVQHDFTEKKRILAVEEFLDLILEKPKTHLRGAAQYLKNCFDFFGTSEVDTPSGKETRFSLFDLEFDQGEGRLAGQERVQTEIYRALENFVRQGRSDRLLLLHGPNGSAKSTIFSAMMRGLEHYSEQDDGALYRFYWIFPSEKVRKGQIGFGGKGEVGDPSKSYAYLPEEEIEARLPSEIRDHPLLLLPFRERESFLQKALENAPKDFVVPDILRFGELSHRSRMIYEALLTAYQGDYLAVLRHIQVERFSISRRYRTAAVTVEPQISVDARSRQVTMERSLQALPSALQNLSLYMISGELVDANRGILEYNDLLKRPLEAFKYLLSTCENGRVSLEHTILFLDVVLVGSANDKYLNAFRETPDWPSFRGRLEIIRVPYLLDYLLEEEIYQNQISQGSVRKHIAPHTMHVAALWAILTRLKPPQPENYAKPLRDIVADLTPLEKAELYVRGRVPPRLDSEDARLLETNIDKLFEEFDSISEYEGLRGASAREVKSVLLNAAQDKNFSCLSPLAAFEELRNLVKEGPSTYEFLQRRANNGYFDHEGFVDVASERYLERADTEIRGSLGLIEAGQYYELFVRYVSHVSHWVKGEKLLNQITGKYEEPDLSFMTETENGLEVEETERESFRRHLISQIGAWSIDHPKEAVDYKKLFPQHLERLEQEFFEQNKKQLQRGLNVLLHLAAGEEESDPQLRAKGEAALERLQTQFGYCQKCLRETVSYLLKKRYA